MNNITLKNFLVVLLHAFIVWALCGLTMAIGPLLISMRTTLVVHAIGAPVYAALVSIFYYKKFDYTTPFYTALIFLLFIVALDAGLVAPVFEKSFVMFKSILGTWLPFLLIFLSTFITGIAIKRSEI